MLTVAKGERFRVGGGEGFGLEEFKGRYYECFTNVVGGSGLIYLKRE